MPERLPEVIVVVEQLRRKVPGGTGTYAAGLLRGLQEVNPSHVTLMASKKWTGADPLRSYGFPVLTPRLPGPLLTRLWDLGRGQVRTRALVHSTSLAFPPARHCVVTVHDLAWRELPDAFPPRGRRWHEHALSRALESQAHLVTSSLETEKALREAGVAQHSVTVIEPGSDHMAEPDVNGTEHLLQHLGVEGDFVLSVGTLEPRKNLPRMMEAYAAARSSLPHQPPLLIVGAAGWAQRELLPSPGIIPVGWVEPEVLSGLITKSLCLVYVSLLEGFGLPALEAMALGTPVVASPMPSTGGAARTVDPLDSGSIADGIRQVVCDEELRKALIEKGAARAAELTWEETARKHLQLWSRLGEGK